MKNIFTNAIQTEKSPFITVKFYNFRLFAHFSFFSVRALFIGIFKVSRHSCGILNGNELKRCKCLLIHSFSRLLLSFADKKNFAIHFRGHVTWLVTQTSLIVCNSSIFPKSKAKNPINHWWFFLRRSWLYRKQLFGVKSKIINLESNDIQIIFACLRISMEYAWNACMYVNASCWFHLSYTLLFEDSFFILRESFFFHSPKNPEAEIKANNRQRNSKSNG